MTAEICQFLDWDTEFFGRRIARASLHRLDRESTLAIDAWCQANAIDCLYFLAEADDPQTIHLAEESGYRLMEVRLNYDRSLKDWDPLTRPQPPQGITTRRAQPEDVPILLPIARTSYVDSRYFFDKKFPEDKWQAYYATWVKKSCDGGAPVALVAEKDGEIVGYITGQVDQNDPTIGIYELTGVADAARKAGVGHELFRAGLDEFVRLGVTYVWLATQGRNIPTQRMIQRNGFATRSCQLYFHKWFS